jgi:catechol 2,3-dioxygenase-like lactoylglutathione lyase family enzyme
MDAAIHPGFPAHLPVRGLRVIRASAAYTATVAFYRDVVGLTVLDIFGDGEGGDATIFGLPDSSCHLEITRALHAPPQGFLTVPDQHLVFYLGEESAVARATEQLAAAGGQSEANPNPYWDSRRAVTYRDPDGCGVILVPWVYGQSAKRG